MNTSQITRKGLLALVAGLAFLSIACSKNKKASTLPEVDEQPAPAPATPSEETAPPQVEATVSQPGPEPIPSFGPIYFEFDSAVLRADARDTLARIGDFMLANADATIVVSGHTDERGTTEYNLALGDSRAAAARDYLVRMGIDPGRIRTITYGEERPAEYGSNESAWAKNRRDEWELSRAQN